MNILLINHYAGSKYHGMAYRPYYFAKEWVKAGHDVTIIAADKTHLRHKNVLIPEDKDYYFENIDGIRYLWLRTITYKDNSLNRAFNIASFIFQLYRFSSFISKTLKPNIVITSSTYPADVFPAYRIVRQSKAKYIFEIRDLWPLSPIILGNYSKYHPFIQAMQYSEDYCYKHCDAVVSVLPKVSEYTLKHGLPQEKLHIIENGLSLEEWENHSNIPDSLNSLIDSEKAKGHFLLGYTGNHSSANSLHTIIEAAEKLKDTKASFILVGNGRDKSKLMSLANKKHLNNVFFYDSIPKESIPDLLSKFDCLLITWKNLWELYKFGISPNKLMDYMMAGKPIIHAVNAGNDPVEDSGCGITVPAEDPPALADAIIKLMNTTEEERYLMGQKGREYVIKNHDYRVLAQKYLEVMERLLVL
ncbi:MAG: glycosyltransferase family 4 protein [Candidatus Riflebacteria bacterium]|nr:glycosyltransferase family 4 protein [Candidatus Riflebacteria bacterium]